MRNPEYTKLPEHMISGARLWIEEGIATGSFMLAVLENNLKESFIRADSINRARLQDIVAFFYQEAPAACWGSKEAIKEWRKLGGLRGIKEKADADG